MPISCILCERDEMCALSVTRRLFVVELWSVMMSSIPEFLVRCCKIWSRYSIVKHVTNGSTHMTDQVCNCFDVQFVFCYLRSSEGCCGFPYSKYKCQLSTIQSLPFPFELILLPVCDVVSVELQCCW